MVTMHLQFFTATQMIQMQPALKTTILDRIMKNIKKENKWTKDSILRKSYGKRTYIYDKERVPIFVGRRKETEEGPGWDIFAFCSKNILMKRGPVLS